MLWHKLQGAGGAGGGNPIEYVGGYAEAFVGTTSDVTITFGGNLIGGLDSSASAGDFVLVWFGTSSTTDRNLVVSGYTEVIELYRNSLNRDTNMVIAYKFMGSTPDTTITLTGGTLNTADAGTIVVQVFRNVNQTTPIESYTTTTNGTAIPNPPDSNPVGDGVWIVGGGAGGHSQGVQTYSSSDLTNFLSVGADDTNDSTIGAGYIAGSTDTNPATFVFSGSSSFQDSYAAATIVLSPATP